MTVYKGIAMIVTVIFDLSLSRNGSHENDALMAIASFLLSLCLIQ